jgi:hypothetical protein
MTKIDFSEFHPLDHWPWQRRCWSRQPQGSYSAPFKGGPWHHLKLTWQQYRRHQLARLLWWRWIQKYRCPRGVHRTVIWYHVGPTYSGFIRTCNYCPHRCATLANARQLQRLTEAFTEAFPPDWQP